METTEYKRALPQVCSRLASLSSALAKLQAGLGNRLPITRLAFQLRRDIGPVLAEISSVRLRIEKLDRLINSRRQESTQLELSLFRDIDSWLTLAAFSFENEVEDKPQPEPAQ